MRTQIIQNRIGLAVVACLLAGAVDGQILQDDFDGPTIDSSSWQTSTPFSDSAITVSNGFAVFQNRGRLLSVTNLPSAIEITGRFAFTGNPHDSFVIQTRCDGASTSPTKYFDRGIEFGFSIQADNGQTNGNTWISRYAYPNLPPIDLSRGNFPTTTNVFYNFRITDDGKNTALYIGDLSRPLLEGRATNQFGHQLGLFNREGAGGGTFINAGSMVRLDYLSVAPFVPPPKLDLRVQQVELCWNSVPTNIYQVQFRSLLTTNIWTDLGGPLRSDGETLCILDPVPRESPRKFYRLLVLP